MKVGDTVFVTILSYPTPTIFKSTILGIHNGYYKIKGMLFSYALYELHADEQSARQEVVQYIEQRTKESERTIETMRREIEIARDSKSFPARDMT